MRLRRSLVLATVIAGLSAGAVAGRAEPLAWIAYESASRDAEVTAAARSAILDLLEQRTDLVDPEATRAALRKLRLRAPEAASAETLSRLAGELGARWLLTASLHDAPTGFVPDLTLGARLYDGETGRLVGAGFRGMSGIDERGLLGLGEIGTVRELAPRLASELLEPLLDEARDRTGAVRAPGPTDGGVAIVPFTATARNDAFVVASAATEAFRERLLEHGTRLAEPGCVRAGLRHRDVATWGELTAGSREAIRAECAVERMVTGSVERWESAGGEMPEPVIAIALRLIDAEDGRVLWAGSLEARGWDHPGWFGLRRYYSRGRLLEDLLERLASALEAFMATGESPVFAGSS